MMRQKRPSLGRDLHEVPSPALLLCPVCGKPKGEPIHGDCIPLPGESRPRHSCINAVKAPVDPAAIYLTVREVAAMAACSTSCVRYAIAAGELVALSAQNIRVRGPWLTGHRLYAVHPEDARAWVDGRLAQHDNAPGR